MRLPLLPLDLGLARGEGSVWTFECCARARLCLFSSFGSCREGGCSVAVTSPARAASSVACPRSSQHAPRWYESREVSVDHSLSRFSRVSRSSDRGTRKDRRARCRSDSSRDRGRRSRSRSAYRSRLSGRERRRQSSSRSLSSRKRSRRERSQSLDRSRSWGDWSRSSDRYRSHRDRSRRDRSRSSDRYRSRRQRSRSPARQGARSDYSRSRDLPGRSRGPVDDLLPPLTVRGQRRGDGEPDVSSRRVWRRLLSPRILLSLRRLL